LKKSLLFITRSALIAALYFVFSIIIAPISFGPIQFRISEIFVLLPVLMVEAIPGLTIGCFLCNFFFSSVYDALIGTVATLIASIITYILKKNIPLSSLPPIVLNSLLVPTIWLIDGTQDVYWINVGMILLSELIICGIIGVPFTYLLKQALLNAHIINPLPSKYDSEPYQYLLDSKEESEDD